MECQEYGGGIFVRICLHILLGRGELRQNTTDFTKFITLTTYFGLCGPSSGHKSTRKTICSFCYL